MSKAVRNPSYVFYTSKWILLLHFYYNQIVQINNQSILIIGWSSLTKYEQKLKLLKNHSENVLNRAAQRALEHRSQLAAMTTQMRFNVNMLAEKLKSDMQDLTCQSREVEVIKLQKQATQPTTLLDLVLEPLSHPLICIPPHHSG